MKPKIKEKWLAALRSGEYKQGKGGLRSEDNKYCCLGLLCQLHRESTKKKDNNWMKSSGYYKYLESRYHLSEKVKKWSGLKSDAGTFKQEDCKSSHYLDYSNLAELNDNNKSFKQIARIIEKNF